jgi:peptide deformylase
VNAPESTPIPLHQTEEGKNLKLDIIVYPNKFLRFKTTPFTVEQIASPLVKDVAGLMIAKMYELQGVGLAANQVGVPNSIFVMDHQYHQSGERKPKVFLNPHVIFADTEKGIEVPWPGEGCLSVPYDFQRPIPRPHMIHIGWTDQNGTFQADWFEDFEAIVIQHELDHLEGHLFIDRLSKLKQDMFIRKVKKIRRRYSKGFKAALKEMKRVKS